MNNRFQFWCITLMILCLSASVYATGDRPDTSYSSNNLAGPTTSTIQRQCVDAGLWQFTVTGESITNINGIVGDGEEVILTCTQNNTCQVYKFNGAPRTMRALVGTTTYLYHGNGRFDYARAGCAIAYQRDKGIYGTSGTGGSVEGKANEWAVTVAGYNTPEISTLEAAFH